MTNFPFLCKLLSSFWIVSYLSWTMFHSKKESLFQKDTSESIRRGKFANYLFLGVLSPGKSYLLLQNFEKALLESLIRSNGISLIGKSYVF